MHNEAAVLLRIGIRFIRGGELGFVIQAGPQLADALRPTRTNDRLLTFTKRVVHTRACQDRGDLAMVVPAMSHS